LVYVDGLERGVRPMGLLVDVDDLVEVLEAGDATACSPGHHA
jgi:hypothetical protein